MNEKLLSLSWWLERWHWLQERKEVGIIALLLSGLGLLAAYFRDALWKWLLECIQTHPEQVLWLATVLLCLSMFWGLLVYRRLWKDEISRSSRLIEVERLLDAERSKVAKLEAAAPKPPGDPLNFEQRRVLTYLVNSGEAPIKLIQTETGLGSSVPEIVRTLMLTHGFVGRVSGLPGEEQTVALTELGERYVGDFNIPTINRGTMKPNHDDTKA